MMFSRQKYIFIFSLVLMMSYGCGFMPLQNTNTKIKMQNKAAEEALAGFILKQLKL